MAPMTIHEARAMQDADVALDENAVAQAEREADEAEAAAATLENSAIEGGKGAAAPALVIEKRAVAEFARERAGRVRDRADRAAAARRLLELEAVGKDVEQIHAAAATPDAGMVAALQQIAAASETLRQLAGAHNSRVRDAVARARQLGAEPAAPSGPRASSAHVTVHTGHRKVQSGSAVVQLVDTRTIDAAVELAIKGDPAAAAAHLNAARTIAPPKRFDHYYVGANGMIQGQNDGTRRDGSSINPWPKAVAKGEARELTPAEVEAYIDGRLHGGQGQA